MNENKLYREFHKIKIFIRRCQAEASMEFSDDSALEFIKYLEKLYKWHKKFALKLFEYSFENLEKDYDKFELIDNLLSTDIDIFKPWYKKMLVTCLNSEDYLVRLWAKSLYGLYKESFDKIEI